MLNFGVGGEGGTMDKYEGIRSLAFPQLAGLLGIDLQRFHQRKDEWTGYCPIHQSQANNGCFSYSNDGRFHCFSCGAKGSGAIDLAKAVRQLNFQSAVELLKASTPVVTDTPVNHEESPSPNQLKPYTGKYEKFKVECEWLTKRIPSKEILERYGVFCYNNPARKSAYSGRVMLPVKCPQGVLYGYLGRLVDSSGIPHTVTDRQTDTPPKYLFPKDLPKSRFLFGAYELLSGQVLNRDGKPYSAPLRVLYAVESPFCCLKFASLGLPAVSPFGWSVSAEQVDILTKIAKGIVYLPDRNKSRDCAGVVHCLAKRLWTRVPSLPDGIDDPEDLSLEQILSL